MKVQENTAAPPADVKPLYVPPPPAREFFSTVGSPGEESAAGALYSFLDNLRGQPGEGPCSGAETAFYCDHDWLWLVPAARVEPQLLSMLLCSGIATGCFGTYHVSLFREPKLNNLNNLYTDPTPCHLHVTCNYEVMTPDPDLQMALPSATNYNGRIVTVLGQLRVTGVPE